MLPSDDSPPINLSSKQQLIIVTVLPVLLLVASLLAIVSFAMYCWKYAVSCLIHNGTIMNFLLHTETERRQGGSITGN